MKRVLVVDDDRDMCSVVVDGLADRGYDAVGVSSSTEALAKLGEPFDAVVTDLRMPGIDGLELVAQSRKIAPERPVIVMTAFSAVDTAVESIRRGAYHYLTKPFKLDELELFVGRALEEARLRTRAASLEIAMRDRFALQAMVGASTSMQRVFDLAARVATANAPLLILGETGTGKGLLARALHAESRRSGPFVTVNCAALPETLLESELFGHKKGAFTGATQSRDGLLVQASSGTLLLDEIGEMALPLQAKLLDVIERGMVRPLGSDTERPVDARIIAATHRDLRERVGAGSFRQDLLYRLEVVVIEIPALRHRREDLPLLIGRFLGASQARHPSSPLKRFSKPALDRLMAHEWPGNVRELENVIERVVLLARGEEADVPDLPGTVGQPSAGPLAFGAVVTMREMQRRYAAYAFEKLGATKVQTAEALGIDVKTLSKLLASEGTEPSGQ
jgi:two-component system, NtrC family, response regulator HydG